MVHLRGVLAILLTLGGGSSYTPPWETGTVRVALPILNYRPWMYVDPDTQAYGGFFLEVYRLLIEDYLGLSMELVHIYSNDTEGLLNYLADMPRVTTQLLLNDTIDMGHMLT